MELEFRLWNDKAKRYYDVLEIDFVYRRIKFGDLRSTFSNYINEDILELFTGRTDDDNTKIYKGDIVRVENDREIVVGVVEYSNNFMAFVVKDGDYTRPIWLHEDGSFSIKVLGNIHENGELL